MFNKDYSFKGKHNDMVIALTSIVDNKTNFKLFNRNIDVLLIAPIIGFLYGRMAEKDNITDDKDISEKKINYQQLCKESDKINYNYELIMILHNREKESINVRLDRAFKYANNTLVKEECYKIFEKYILGGIEVLYEKLIVDAKTLDDYIKKIDDFVSEYKERYEKISDNSDNIFS